jgi:hypothetical protein
MYGWSKVLNTPGSIRRRDLFTFSFTSQFLATSKTGLIFCSTFASRQKWTQSMAAT